MKINAHTKLCIIIGDPVENTLSPQIHNAGYEALGIDGEFVYAPARVKSDDLATFVSGAKSMGLRGFACKMPHKLAIMNYLDEIDEVARTIGAVNTVVNDNGRLRGYNTDWMGVVAPLEAVAPLKGKQVVLLGAGGASRAAAYGVTNRGAKLTIYNRTLDKAQQLAKEFGGQARSFGDLEGVKDADIIINATAIGEPPKSNETPLPKELVTKNQIVFDIVYAASDTRLIKEAQERDALVIRGTEMLLHQGMEQFRLFTGQDAPEQVMRQALADALTRRGKGK